MKSSEIVNNEITPNIYHVKNVEDIESVFETNSINKVSIRQSTFLWYIHKNRYNSNSEYDTNQMKEILMKTISQIYKEDTNKEDIIIYKKDLPKLKRKLISYSRD